MEYTQAAIDLVRFGHTVDIIIENNQHKIYLDGNYMWYGEDESEVTRILIAIFWALELDRVQMPHNRKKEER